MKIAWNELRSAADRSLAALREYPLVFVAPIICTSAGYRLFSFGFHRAFGRKHLIIELLLYLVVLGFPLGTLAAGIVARMMLLFREKNRPSFKQVGEVASVPGLMRLLIRYNGLVLLWMLLAFVSAAVLFVLGFVVKAFAFSLAHHGAKVPTPHGLSFSYIMLFFLIWAVLTSPYSFVLPSFAVELRHTQDLFRSAVAFARRHLPTISIVYLLECGLVLTIGHMLRPFEKDGSLRAVAVTGLSLLVTSALTTWFELVKAELAFSLRS